MSTEIARGSSNKEDVELKYGVRNDLIFIMCSVIPQIWIA